MYDSTSAVAMSVKGNGGMDNYKAHNLLDYETDTLCMTVHQL